MTKHQDATAHREQEHLPRELPGNTTDGHLWQLPQYIGRNLVPLKTSAAATFIRAAWAQCKTKQCGQRVHEPRKIFVEAARTHRPRSVYRRRRRRKMVTMRRRRNDPAFKEAPKENQLCNEIKGKDTRTRNTRRSRKISASQAPFQAPTTRPSFR